MILVFGSNGQLGSAFRAVLGADAAYVTRAQCDLSQPPAVRPFLASMRPGTIVNCAAYTDVDGAESDLDLAMAINRDSPFEMARFAAENGAGLVTFSTDYVFDGAKRSPYLESDETGPLNAYGRSKLEGEGAVLGSYPEALVVRTSWLVSGRHPNFVRSILRRAAIQPVKVVNDQIGTPTIATDLARMSWEALQRGLVGVLHLANAGPVSRYDFAVEVVRLAGLDPDRVTACRTDEYPTRAVRPAYSALASERWADSPAHWSESLPRVVAEQARRLRAI